jgi:SOS-response transcriptional repressor LexA
MPRQKPADVIAYLVQFQEKLGYTPSLNDMAKGLGMSKSGIRSRLIKLAAEGKIAFDAKVARSYRVL